MTLILTAVCRAGIIQTCDRLVTARRGRQISAHDEQSNKTILFAAIDGSVAISYTGDAYVGSLPTDQWLAETLRNKPVAPGPDGRPAAGSIEQFDRWPNLGQAISCIAEAMKKVMSGRLRPARGSVSQIKVVAAGWQNYRGVRATPFCATIESSTKSPDPVVVRSPRHLGRKLGISAEPDGYLSSKDLAKLLTRLRTDTVDEAEAVMVAETRRIAAQYKTVGPDCMCVILPPRSKGWARVRYDSIEPKLSSFVTPRRIFVAPVAYSPWVVTRGLTLAPARTSGGEMQVRLGKWPLRIESTGPHAGPLNSAQFAQRRPARPR